MLRRVYFATAAGFGSFYLMLPLVPLLGAQHGSDFYAGLLTFVFMAATVATQLVCPWLLRFSSNRRLLAHGSLLVGLPTLAYSASRGVGWMSAVSAIRGAGFGLMTVASSTLVSSMATMARRGRSIGLYGLLSSGMGTFCPALGLSLYRALGAEPAFVLAALASCLACAALVAGHDEPPAANDGDRAPLAPLLRVQFGPGSLALLGGVMLAAVYSFLALRVTRGAGLVILAFGCSFAMARLQLGRLADRRWEAEVLLAASLLAGASGMAGLVFSTSLPLACLCAIAIGAGAGGILSLSLLVMVRRSNGRVAMAATLWNVGYDSGNALGGVGLGAAIGPLGLAGPYALTAILLGVALAVSGAQRLRRAAQRLAAERG